jgi:hypothetical protein
MMHTMHTQQWLVTIILIAFFQWQLLVPQQMVVFSPAAQPAIEACCPCCNTPATPQANCPPCPTNTPLPTSTPPPPDNAERLVADVFRALMSLATAVGVLVGVVAQRAPYIPGGIVLYLIFKWLCGVIRGGGGGGKSKKS